MRGIHYQSMLEYVTDDTLIILNLSDIQKPYGRKLPDLKKDVVLLYYRLQKGVGKLFEGFSPDFLEMNRST